MPLGASVNSDVAPTNPNSESSGVPLHTVSATSEGSPVPSSKILPSVSAFGSNQILSYQIYIPSPWYNFEIFGNTEEHFTWIRDSEEIEVENVIESPSSYNIVFDDKEFSLSYSLPFTNVATITVAGDRTDAYPTCIAQFIIQASPNDVIKKRDILEITLTATVSFPEDTERINGGPSDVSASIETAIKRTTDISSKEENAITSTSAHNIESITDSLMSAESTTQADKITTSNNVISQYNHSSDIVGHAVRYSPTSGVSFGIFILILCLS